MSRGKRQKSRDAKAATAEVVEFTDGAATDDDGNMTTDGFQNLVARMGVGQGTGNINSNATYVNNPLMRSREVLEAMYRGAWIVGVAVDAVAEDMTRAGIEIKSETAPEQIDEIQTALVRLGVWNSILELIKWGRLYGGAAAFINIDGQDPSTPLQIDTIGKGQFHGLRVYDRYQLTPNVQELVPSGIHAGLPTTYTVVSDVATGALSDLVIHHSRIIRSIGNKLPVYQAITEQFWGQSIIERMYDRLVSFDTATMGASNLIQKAHLRTVGVKGLRTIIGKGGKAQDNLVTLFHMMRQLQMNEGITLIDSEDEFATHNYTFAGLSDMIGSFGQQISGATGIPLIRLFGQTPKGLNNNGDNDMRMYYDNVNAAQESRMRDGMLRILRVTYRSLFGVDAPTGFAFDFVPLWQLNEKEQAEIATANTASVLTVYEAGLIDAETAAKELQKIGEQTGTFTNVTDEYVASLAAEAEVPQADPMLAPEGGTPETEPTTEAAPTFMRRLAGFLTRA